MYIPKVHKGLSNSAAIQFAQKYSFALLNSIIDDQIESCHLPLEIEEKEGQLVITGHIARANKLSEAILGQNSATCIFSEPHAYVSSSWYNHVNVPTWNYIAVHMIGKLRKLDGKELLRSLEKMVEHYEEGRKDRYRISDMSEDMLVAHLQGLTGFELEVIEANYKLSQNRNDTDYKNVIKMLMDSDNNWEQEIAKEMLALRPSLK